MHRQAAVAHPFPEFSGGAVSQPTGHEPVIRPSDVEGITGLKSPSMLSTPAASNEACPSMIARTAPESIRSAPQTLGC